VLVTGLLTPGPASAGGLASYVIEPSRIAVTDASSGGFMATQLHVAYSGISARAARSRAGCSGARRAACCAPV
jgi:poly(3-hydroxybutyrate) depolymerase